METHAGAVDLVGGDWDRRDIPGGIHGEHRDRFELVFETAVRVSDVTGHLLQHKPTIVHFSGHGDKEGKLQLQDGRDQSFGVPVLAFAELLEMFKSSVRCVVLNACYSDQLAEAMARHIDCVIGMTASVRDDSGYDERPEKHHPVRESGG